MTRPAPSSAPKLPVSLAANPMLSSWVRFSPEGHVMVFPGKVEIGQGIVTALAQIAADELDVDIGRVQMVRASTAGSPNEGITSGSLSVQQSGRAIRHACAQIRRIFLDAASDRLGVGIDALDVEDGTISGPGNVSTSYWELAAEVSLDRDATPGATPKSSTQRTLAGKSIQRVDIPDKVFAHPRFIHDFALPGMLHGRVLRPELSAARLVTLSEDHARAVAGLVAIVRDGNFAGVVSETEDGAENALRALHKDAAWSSGETLPDEERLAEWLKAQPSEPTVIDTKTASGKRAKVRTIGRQYTRPYLAHASIAPSCAIAQWSGGCVHVWTHSQGVYFLRADLALVLKLPVENIIVEHMEGAGCYGHNAADDVALDAVLLAKAAGGRPVRVQWSRQDEMSHAPFGAAMAIEIEADLDAQGEIVEWRHRVWSNGHTARPGRAAQPALLAASELANPFPRYIATNPPQANGGGADRNSIPLYDFPSWEIECHRLLTMPIRTSALRTLGGQGNVFAIESFIDELATDRGEDPVALRLRHLSDSRAQDVIRSVARRANWKPDKQTGRGYGIGFARYKNTGAYCAVVAEVEGAEDVSVKRLTIAVDVGEAINPDGVINQIEGGAIQATSWVLKERVRFDRQRITSNSWASYPILRFSEVPEVQVELIPRPDSEPLGAGEAAHGPVTAAIANAVFDALGVRIRNLPITRDSLIAAMELAT
ncbi:MAG: xanthine dehydrogenase family protein molybdopterin-binding subunit [Alphaproteobacteria bacterium]|nr:MAG: xanthine dehydrogenase family protein molybdopterin-binding subunit [Alphaproteobacteria bacterium]